MTKKAKLIYFFVGTTAELIKLSPVIRELKKRKLGFKIIATNQNKLHFDNLIPIIGKCKADYTFIMKPYSWPNNIYLRFVIWILKSFGNYLIYFKNEFSEGRGQNSYFIVHGDTITALIGAFVAKVCHVKLVHIESGLRSFNFLEPFPEELCRFMISWLADIHFSPNKWAVGNLKRKKGIKVNTFNNTVSESVNTALQTKSSRKITGLRGQKYFIFVVHRQEHTLFNKKSSKGLIEHVIGKANENLKCVFIMHKLTEDYLVNQKLYAKINRNKNVVMPSRLPYIKFIKLLSSAEFIATDGGSNQEEAYYLGTPCLILRNCTERIEGLNENAVLAGNDINMIDKFIEQYKVYKRKHVVVKKKPSKIIVDSLLH